MRYLFFVSIFSILLSSGCQPVKPARLIPVDAGSTVAVITPDTLPLSPFVDPIFEKGLFKATLDIGKHHLTGLAFIKKIQTEDTDSTVSGTTYRMVFSNEFGMTYFDIETGNQTFHVNYCFGPLDKKMLWKVMKTDLKLLFPRKPDQGKESFFLQDQTNLLVSKMKQGNITRWNLYSPPDTLKEVRGKSTLADHATITFSNFSNGFPSRIMLTNALIKLKFSLSLISIN